MQHVHQMIERDFQIRARGLLFMGKQIPDQAEDMFATFLGRNEQLDLIREEQQAHLVVVLNSGKGHHGTNFGSNLPLESAGRREIFRTGDIHRQNDCLLPFLLEDFDEGLRVAGRHVPVNIADIVPELIGADLGKVHPGALKGRMVLASKDVADQTLGTDLDLPDSFEEFLGDHRLLY